MRTKATTTCTAANPISNNRIHQASSSKGRICCAHPIGESHDNQPLTTRVPSSTTVLFTSPIAALWVVVAFSAARWVAMGFNHIADRAYDARNPRTMNRELPRGTLTLGQAWTSVALASALFSEPNPTVIKGVLAAQGRIATPDVRLPLLPASDTAVADALRATGRVLVSVD